jgi:hypothetical protein
MLSKVIKEMIEAKFGHPVRYPKDCELLSVHITDVCKTSISGSTLKRLFGFAKVKPNEQPRTYTLDIISAYIGYECWEKLAGSLLKGTTEPAHIELQELQATKAKKGESFLLGFGAGKEVSVEYLGKNQFLVLTSTDTRIQKNDRLDFSEATLHYPLMLREIFRADKNTGEYVLGKVSGLTSIRKFKGKASGKE